MSSGNICLIIVTRNSCKTYPNDEFHIDHIGTMVEDMENTLRSIIEVYIKKSKEVN